MVDIAAKWSKQLYEEARRDIANVAVPKKTLKKLIADKTATPGVPKVKASAGVPSFIAPTTAETLLNIAKTGVNVAIGSREEKVKSVASFIPATVTTTTVKAPDYSANITYKNVDLGFGTVKVPTIDFGGSVEKTSGGILQTTFKPKDYRKTEYTETPTQFLTKIIEESKASSPEARQFWETQTIGGTNITLPSIAIPEFPDIFGGLKDFGKYALIGIVGLAAILLLTRKN